jgi:hypothetical protein
MKVYVLEANTMTDATCQVTSGGYIVGTFSSHEKASEALDVIGDDYTRKRCDYEIQEFEMDA